MNTTAFEDTSNINYAEAMESEDSGLCPALLEAAHPEVYRRNAFRVMGLSVEATPREILQHIQKLQMMQKYNAKVTPRIPLALDPPPDEHAMREATHKLQDPEKRLIDEFFWFWPCQLGQSKTDQALAFLTENDIDRAIEYWRQMEQSSETYVSMHNLAVLFHCLALDLEQIALSRKLDLKELETLGKYWDYAFKRWKVVLNHEPFWSRLTARIRALEDPRLTTGLARRIHQSLPFALLSINAALAVRYAEIGNFREAKRQVEIMSWWETIDDSEKIQKTKPKRTGKAHLMVSSLGDSLMQKALKQACEPLRQRVKIICKNAENQVNKDPSHGDKATREMIEQTKLLLTIFDVLLSAGDVIRDAVHDEIALCALNCVIRYCNETQNWKVSLKLLERALSIAAGQAVRDRIQETIDIVKVNLQYGTCWFCKQNPAEDEAILEVKMYGDVNAIPTWDGTKIIWRHGTVKVPRCARCKSAHNRENACIGVGGVVGSMLGWGFFSFHWDIGSIFASLVIGGGIGALIGLGIGRALYPKGVLPESAKSEFPSVKQLLSQGWNFGERPSSTG